MRIAILKDKEKCPVKSLLEEAGGVTERVLLKKVSWMRKIFQSIPKKGLF